MKPKAAQPGRSHRKAPVAPGKAGTGKPEAAKLAVSSGAKAARPAARVAADGLVAAKVVAKAAPSVRAKAAVTTAPSRTQTRGEAARTAPAKAPPASVAPAKAAPVKVAPVKGAPVKGAPAKVAPVKAAPVAPAKLVAGGGTQAKPPAAKAAAAVPKAGAKTPDTKPADAKPVAAPAAAPTAEAKPAGAQAGAQAGAAKVAPVAAVAHSAPARPGLAEPRQAPAPIAPLAAPPVAPATSQAAPPSAPAPAEVAASLAPAAAASAAAPRPAAVNGRPIPPPRPLAKAENFIQGDYVVYPTHGVGKVERIAIEEIAGHKLELIHITFEENRMTLRVPVAKARTAGLRKLASRDLFEEALAVLKGRARIKRTMWSRRAQEYEAKINSGDPLAIAEVVRDLHRNAGQPDQSFSERQIYESAMDRLAAELAALDRTDKPTAAIKLAEFLKTV